MLKNQNILYFDCNSTTQIDERVLNEMMPYLTDNFANANSSHFFGLSTNESIKVVRNQVAELISAEDSEIYFTSGATEAINTALKGVAERYSNKGKHIITSITEHHAVLDTCKYLESIGFEITYLNVGKDGLIDLDLLKSALRVDTILVSIMYVNNETGVIQPIQEFAHLTHEFDALFMSDCTQAVGKMDVNVNELGIDILCLSGHKIYAPKGIGALYLKKTISKLTPLIHGGSHENGMRSGTLNVPSIVALGKACEIAQNEMELDSIKIKKLRDALEDELLTIEGSFLNGNKVQRIFNTINIGFKDFDANVFIGKNKQLAVSNGSACTSAIVEPSHVLTAMGLSLDEAFASLRISLGKFNTASEIEILKTLLSKQFINQQTF